MLVKIWNFFPPVLFKFIPPNLPLIGIIAIDKKGNQHIVFPKGKRRQRMNIPQKIIKTTY